MALTTLSVIKAFLNIVDTNQDTWLTALQLAAEAAIKDYCQQNFESATYTEYYSGSGTRAIVLRQRPVTSITSVHVDNDGNFGFGTTPFPAITILESGSDYALDLDTGSTISRSGILWRVNTIWQQNERTHRVGQLYQPYQQPLGNIKVVYVAGYTTIPQDLQYAVCLMVSTYKNTATYGGVSINREKIGPLEYELYRPSFYRMVAQPDFGTLRQVLHKYKEIAL